MARRTWAEVDLTAIVDNYNIAVSVASGAPVMPVVKADAYGHGAIPVAQALHQAGAGHFAVATGDEALALRAAGLTGEVLVLGHVSADAVRELAARQITLTIGSLETAASYRAALGNEHLPVHIAVDSGMRRLGLSTNVLDKTRADIVEILSIGNLAVKGIYTHFAAADNPDEDCFTRRQLQDFLLLRQALEIQGVFIPCWHCANSAALLRLPETHLGRVRPGILLYGASPDAAEHPPYPLRPAMRLLTTVSQVKTLLPGDTVGYGRTYRTQQPMRIAVLNIGYADGIPRAASGNMAFLIHGQRIRQIGRICMDMCMADVSTLSEGAAQPGDVVTVFGADLTVGELAAAAGTIPYELFCGLSRRVERVYIPWRTTMETTQ